MIYNFLERFLIHFDISILYKTPQGIKVINQIFKNEILHSFGSNEVFLLDPEELYLGVDGLKDQFTLLNCTLRESPHYELMQRLLNNDNLESSDYVRRLRTGTLDLRNKSSVLVRKKIFHSNLKLVNMDQYDPIFVYKHKGRYYISDGKHRASLCLSLNKSIKCIDVSCVKYDSYFYWIYRKMSKYNFQNFKKHFDFYSTYFSSPKKGNEFNDKIAY